MECKKCGSSCIDGAVFCSNCGARLDDKKPCPACGKLIENKSAFCVYCGKRLDGKNACVACGTVFAGKFCPKCGRRMDGQVETGKPRQTEKRKSNGTGASVLAKTFSACGSIALAFGTLFAIIFVFLIGGSLETDMYSQAIKEQGFLGSADNIFYYFGQIYKDLNKFDVNLSAFYNDLWESSANIYAVVGTVSMAVVMISVVLFGLIALVKYTRRALGYTQKKTDKWAILCILSFFVGVGVFFMLNQCSLDLSVSEGRDTRVMQSSYSLNGGTVCGLVFCLIFLFVGIGCLIIKKASSLKNKEILTKTLVSLTGVICIAVVLSLLISLGVSAKASFNYTYYDDYDEYYIKRVMDGALDLSFSNFNILASELGELSQEVLSWSAYKEFSSSFETAVVCFNISVILVVLTCLIAIWAIYARIKNLISENSVKGKAASILLLILVVGLAITFFVGTINLYEATSILLESAGDAVNKYDLEYSFGLAGMIVVIVLALINAFLPIIQKAFLGVKRNDASPKSEWREWRVE